MYRIALMSDTAAQDMIPSLSLLSHKVHVFPLDTAHTALPATRDCRSRCAARAPGPCRACCND